MMSQNAMDFLGKTFRYRPRREAEVASYFGDQQGKVISVITSLPDTGRGVELCFSDDDHAYYALDELELLELVQAQPVLPLEVAGLCWSLMPTGRPSVEFVFPPQG